MGAFKIIVKDLRLLSRDRRALSTLLALPMIFIAIIGMTTGQLMGWRNENQVLKIGVIDHSGGSPFVKQILNKLEQKESVRTVPYPDLPTADRALDGKDCVVVMVIGPKFSELIDDLGIRDVLNTKAGPLSHGLAALDIQLVNRPTFAGAGGIVNDLMFSAVLRVVVPHVVRHSPAARPLLKRAGIDPDELAEDAGTNPVAKKEPENNSAPLPAPTSTAGLSPQSVPVQAAVVTANSPPEERQRRKSDDNTNLIYNALVPAYTVMFVFFMVNIMARSFISERDTGTLRRLRISPLRPASILVGKTIPFFVISVTQTVVLFVCGKLLFGMSWGANPWLLIPVILCTSLSATTLGLMVATLVKSDSQVSAYGTSLVIIMAGISGCFMPREWLPEVMLQISRITPHAWALVAYEQILVRQFTDLRIVGNCCAMLLCYSAIYFLIGRWRFGSVD